MSIDDVARAAEVSTATVSRALSGRGQVSASTRERVLDAADRLGYVVSAAASSLASGRARNIGVLLPVVDRWFFSTVLAGIASSLQQAGYDITLYALTDDLGERAAVFETFLRRQRVDAVIAIAISLDVPAAHRLLELGLPVIALGAPHPVLPTLAVDDVAVGKTATGHLLALGHRDIADIGAEVVGPAGDFHVPTLRRRGFAQAMTDAGLPVPAARLAAGDFTIAGGRRAALSLLQRPDRPSAIFAASDEMAIGALLAARDLGITVPAELSVVGVDGHELGEEFGLTTIDQFPLGQGRRAVAAILAALEDSPAPASSELPFELVERGSTAPPPAAPA